MEIERKFIVHNLPDNLDSYPHSEIEQGYLCMEPVIRIRRMNKQYFLTFKSKGLMARTEHEFPLDKAAYEHLLPKVDGILISKTRYKIPDEHGFVIELDVFHGEYEGLVMAEVEFPSEEVAVEYEGPEWFEIINHGRIPAADLLQVFFHDLLCFIDHVSTSASFLHVFCHGYQFQCFPIVCCWHYGHKPADFCSFCVCL